jgi:hypothetical protein
MKLFKQSTSHYFENSKSIFYRSPGDPMLVGSAVGAIYNNLSQMEGEPFYY